MQIAQESTSVKEHITIETASLRKAIFDQAKHDKLLRSLKYSSMNERRNRITNPAADTFEWIFHPEKFEEHLDRDGSGVDEDDMLSEYYFRLRDPESYHKAMSARKTVSLQFLEWLRSVDKDFFWISGKPGSGKSTLMKFLATHPKTLDGLRTSGKSFLVLSHFIWSAGQPMERQIKGVLCSLLHQLLESVKEITGAVLEQYSYTASKDSIHDWSESELTAVLRFAIENADGNGICIFVDGLDEIDPDHSDGLGQKYLLEVLGGIRALSPVKMCVAGRPEPILKTKLSQSPTFKIHEVTHWDIWKFASSIFRQRFKQFSHVDHRGFLHQVYSMAEGVFLWVALALRSLEMGLEKGDNIEKLQARLSKLPKGLHDFYTAMWGRQGEEEAIYREDAAIYFNYTLIHQDLIDKGGKHFLVEEPPLKLADMFLAKDTALMKRFLSQDLELSSLAQMVISELELFACRLEVCCAGMLEVVRTDPSPLANTVAFIHRSAKEFFEDPKGGHALLQYDPASKSQRLIELAKALLTTEVLLADVGIPPREMCARPDKFLLSVVPLLDIYSNGLSSPANVFEVVNLVEHLMTTWPCTRIQPWPMMPWIDFLGVMASAGLSEVLQESLKVADSIGTVSSDYNAYLLTAALTGCGGNISPRILKTIQLLIEREINPEFRSFDFFKAPHTAIPWGAWYTTPLEAAAGCFLAGSVKDDTQRAMAPVISRLLDLGADLSKVTRFSFWTAGFRSASPSLTYAFSGWSALAWFKFAVESTLALLLDMVAQVIYRVGMIDDGPMQRLAEQITESSASRDITRIIYAGRTYSGSSTEKAAGLFSRLVVSMRTASVGCGETTDAAPCLTPPGLGEIWNEIRSEISEGESMSLPALLKQDIAWRWNDEKVRRPWRYRDVPEPPWDVSAHMEFIRQEMDPHGDDCGSKSGQEL